MHERKRNRGFRSVYWGIFHSHMVATLIETVVQHPQNKHPKSMLSLHFHALIHLSFRRQSGGGMGENRRFRRAALEGWVYRMSRQGLQSPQR